MRGRWRRGDVIARREVVGGRAWLVAPVTVVGATIFHTVDAARYATLDVSDLNPYPTIAIVFLIAALSFAGAWWAISRGPNLRY